MLPTSCVDLLFTFIFILSFFTRCTFTVQSLAFATSLKQTEIDQTTTKNVEKDFSENKVIQTPVEQNVAKPSDSEIKNEPIHRDSTFALEGGGLPEHLTPSTLSHIDLEINDNHSKSVKGRKGVVFSKVYPRKGVDEKELLRPKNISSAEHLPDQQSSLSISEKDPSTSNKTTGTNIEKLSTVETSSGQKFGHPKKPLFVSDKEDDDFDGIIKTSTNGEDYIIIGIVIVIGIWFSVFGALIFYRRAGEYWDRRHYRRMDFLVEGMYND